MPYEIPPVYISSIISQSKGNVKQAEYRKRVENRAEDRLFFW
jgi:hypothetical protein